MCGRCDHLDDSIRRPRRPRPKLGHGHVGETSDPQFVEVTRPVALDEKPQPPLAGQLVHALVVVLRHQVGLHASKIEKETLGNARVAHQTTEKRGQIGGDRVTDAAAKFVREIRGPVLHAGLVAVDGHRGRSLCADRGGIGCDLVDHMAKMKLGRSEVEFVDLQTASGGGGGDVLLPGAGMADT